MNEYEVTEAEARWRDHPTLGPATMTLSNLMHWTNSNSDGWPYWRKPTQAAAKLMGLIMAAEGARRQFGREHVTVTPDNVRRAYTPIKAFLTRQKADHGLIVEVGR